MCSPGSLAVSVDTKPFQPLQALTGGSSRGTGHLVTEEHLRRGSQHHRGKSTEDRAHARQAPLPPGRHVLAPVPSVHTTVCVCVQSATRPPGPHPGDSGLWHAPYPASGKTKPPTQGLGIQAESHANTPSQVPPCLPGWSHPKGSAVESRGSLSH